MDPESPAPFLPVPAKKVSWRVYTLGFLAIVFLVTVVVGVSSQAPASFVPNTIVHVSKNMSLSTVGNLLKKKNVIKSTFLFRIVTNISGGGSSVQAGDYLFKTPPLVWQVASRLIQNDQGFTLVRVTIPEGTSVRGMGAILNTAFNASSTFTFKTKSFLSLASTSEGYLFPDTYLLLPNVTPSAVVSTMKNTFNQKIKTIAPLIAASHRSTKDIVIMASILEKEALVQADRQVIAGILWKRLDSGFLLQVDPPFAYAIGKTSDALTREDLQVDSPYNTYKNKGLPPTPINNPGLESLTAAATASTTPYWYYLSDKKGVMHYAVTYDQHLANRTKYLGK